MQTEKRGQATGLPSATYVVQISKRSDSSSTELAGVVEDISSGLVAHFSCVDDLLRFLSGREGKPEESQS
jgi:hypothetical protein